MEIGRNYNGWLIKNNNYDGFPSEKPYLAFHPLYDGKYWEGFDTIDELKIFCTKEKLDQWSEELI